MNHYIVKRVSRSRSIRVRVEPSGEVVVTAPKYAPKFLIDRFVKINQDWIEKQQQQAGLVRMAFPALDWEKKIVSYLGRLYNIRLRITDDRLQIRNNEMIISPITGLELDAKKMLVRWLKQEGEREITVRTKHWAEVMQTDFEGIKFRQQKSRWGSCTRDNRLSFNWRLIHFKPEIIDYVVIHELAHTKHHDHSQTFWEMVTDFDPGYKQKVRFLKHQRLETI